MNRSKFPMLEDELVQSDEARRLAEILQHPSETDEKELEACIKTIMDSPEIGSRVLRELELDSIMLLHRATRERRSRSGEKIKGLQRALQAKLAGPAQQQARRVRPSLVAAGVATALVIAGGMRYLHASADIVPNATLELPDRSIIKTIAHTSGQLRYSWSTRKIELRSGGAKFEVDTGARPFKVHTPAGIATAVGTDFYVGLEGPPDNRRTLVRVSRGEVRFDPREAATRWWTLAANQEARFTPTGPIKMLVEFTNEPLGKLVPRFIQTDRVKKIVVLGEACRYRIDASLDLLNPSSLIDFIRQEPELKVEGDDAFVVTREGDAPSQQDAALSGCDVVLGGSAETDPDQTP